MKLAIGILAHNEEGSIGATIGSLLKQTVIANPSIGKEIIVVANGCADETAAVAEGALSELAGAANCSARVVDVAAAGKANAWNVFVHEASAKDADFFVLLDADIEFGSFDAIERLVDHLVKEPDILIAPDQPVKRFSERGGPLGALIRALQKTGSDDDHALSGQLYAARAAALRSVVMPIGVVVEDGFLRAMTLTKGFTQPEKLSLIRRAPGVRHFYKPYESLNSIYRYERRQAVGTTINRFLYDEFRQWRAAGLDVTEEIRRRNAANPAWLEALVAERVKKSPPIAVPKNYVLRRVRRRDNWSIGNLAKAPLIAAALLYDLVVAADASVRLRRRAADGARWDSIRKAANTK
ncbi:MAG: glycosyltransferase family 2 protein [Parvularculaceae bacterium]|nr:glycosyltransferase family 2 protein [Parvularculaceae bacterium]